MKALIGVDIGTTNLKAVAFSPGGGELAKASQPNQALAPRPGWAEYDPEGLWGTICLVIREMLNQLPNGVEPAGIAFASMAEAGVLLDRADQPLHPIITWYDQRTVPQAEAWIERIGLERTANVAGLAVRPVYGVMKLLWIKENHPQLYAQAAAWLNLADYGAFKLCGEMGTDTSLASRTMLLDLTHQKWSQSQLEDGDIDPELLAPLVQSGQMLGRVHAKAAAETGLPIGLPVSAGGHDHVCGAFALGITQPGDVFDSMGTAESVMGILDKPRLGQGLTLRNIGQGAHVVPGRFYAMSGVHMSGGAIDWARKLLLEDEPIETAYARMIELAESAPVGSDGVFFLPHLRRSNPPTRDLKAKGAFLGLTAETTQAELVRAVFEGLAYEFKQVSENIFEGFELEPDHLIVTGGGARNRPLLEIKAAVSGLPLHVPQVDEATCLGAAMLAGIGAGVYAGFEEASARVLLSSVTIEPNPAEQRRYADWYGRIYAKLYHSLTAIHAEIDPLH